MRITEKRLRILMDLKPRLTVDARRALMKVLCEGKKVDLVALELGISSQGIRKNIRDLKIMNLKLTSSYDSSLLLSDLATKLCLRDCDYISATNLLSEVCKSLGGQVQRNNKNGEIKFILDDMVFIAYLNDYDDSVHPWGVDSYLA